MAFPRVCIKIFILLYKIKIDFINSAPVFQLIWIIWIIIILITIFLLEFYLISYIILFISYYFILNHFNIYVIFI